jgi:hypothetical protein
MPFAIGGGVRVDQSHRAMALQCGVRP